ncbi:MAG: hypothetical protein LBO09_07870 [Candidatus Peribacteria bacterium]|jgi:hypothetical protein|nr:hypothetical protein [Candidatus Peribacteria bacterium]
MPEEITTNEKNTLGLVALILAIIGLLLTISLFGSFLGVPLLCLALLLGIIALFKRPRGKAVASVVISLLPLGALAYIIGTLLPLVITPAIDFSNWMTNEVYENPTMQTVFQEEGFNSFLESRIEIAIKKANRAPVFENGLSWQDKISGATALTFDLLKAEIPVAVDTWIAEYGLEDTENQLVGGDRDEHGCIGSAGYSWNEDAQECQRPWEQPEAATIVCTMDAKLCPDGSYVGRT